jgi:hypothetical protein
MDLFFQLVMESRFTHDDKGRSSGSQSDSDVARPVVSSNAESTTSRRHRLPPSPSASSAVVAIRNGIGDQRQEGMQRGEGALMAGAILKHPNALRFVHIFFLKGLPEQNSLFKTRLPCVIIRITQK